MNRAFFTTVTALAFFVSAGGNACAQALIQGAQVTSTAVPTSSKPAAKPESEPLELTGMLAAQNETRAKSGLPALKWSTKLEIAAREAAKAGAVGLCSRSSAQKAGKAKDVSTFWAPGLRRLDQPIAQDILARYVVSRWSEANSEQLTRMTAPKAKTVGCAKVLCENQTQIWACKYDD